MPQLPPQIRLICASFLPSFLSLTHSLSLFACIRAIISKGLGTLKTPRKVLSPLPSLPPAIFQRQVHELRPDLCCARLCGLYRLTDAIFSSTWHAAQLVDPRVERALTEAFKATLLQFYTRTPKTCPDYGRIVTARHLRRLTALLEDPAPGLEILAGGHDVDIDDLYMEPTLVRLPLDYTVCFRGVTSDFTFSASHPLSYPPSPPHPHCTYGKAG